MDLFHAGYFWEAHEAWEHVWHESARGTPIESVVRALIRTTAAHVKHRQGVARGVVSHRRGATRHLETVASTVDIGALRIDIASLRASLGRDELPLALPIRRR